MKKILQCILALFAICLVVIFGVYCYNSHREIFEIKTDLKNANDTIAALEKRLTNADAENLSLMSSMNEDLSIKIKNLDEKTKRGFSKLEKNIVPVIDIVTKMRDENAGLKSSSENSE